MFVILYLIGNKYNIIGGDDNMLHIFKCEKCNQEFEDSRVCIDHESECFNFDEIITRNLDNVLLELWNKYKLKIFSRKVICSNFETDCTYPQHMFQIWLECKLPNGNKFSTNHQSFWNCDVTKYEDLYNRLEEIIIPLLDTSYEGIISLDNDDGWYTYRIDEMPVDEIMRRLRGRKIKIEVLE